MDHVGVVNLVGLELIFVESELTLWKVESFMDWVVVSTVTFGLVTFKVVVVIF